MISWLVADQLRRDEREKCSSEQGNKGPELGHLCIEPVALECGKFAFTIHELAGSVKKSSVP